MSVISFATQAIRNLVRGLRLAHKACALAALVNTKIQASNASDEVKNAVLAWKTSTENVCALIAAYYDSLPGD